MASKTTEISVRSINYPCGRMICSPQWSRPRSASESLRDHELWLVWRGRGWMFDGHKNHELRPGFCAWMRPGGIYDAGTDPNDPLGICYIHFSGRFTPHPAEFFHTPDLAFTDLATRRIISAAHRSPPKAWGKPINTGRARIAIAALLEAILLDLLYSTAPSKVSAAQSANALALDAIAAEFRHDPADDTPIADIADRLGFSAEHFSRSFRAHTGQSPQQYRITARIERARHELRQSSLTLQQIADLLGYCDAFAFSKQFKQYTGESPSIYRNR